MTVNVTQLEQALLKKIDATTAANDLLILTKAIKQLQIGHIFSVAAFENLPSLSEVDAGSLYFVEADRQLYISNLDLYAWKPLITPSVNTLWGWGSNTSGVNGDNSTIARSSPVSVVGYVGDWCAISVSDNHAMALKTNGTLWVWGEGGQGQLGINSVVDRSSPVQLNSSEYSWCKITAANQSSLAIRCDGTLWAWGANLLGNNCGVVNSTLSPTSVVGGFTDWCDVSSHDTVAAALRSDGTIWTWGQGAAGALGDNSAAAKYSPVSVVGGFTNWIAVSAGSVHMIALRSDGTVWSWGCNNGGQLGDGTVITRSSPVSIVGGFTDWCTISGGTNMSAAIRTNGELWTWGCARCGALGDNTAVNKSSPVSISGGFTDWCAVDMEGYCFAAAIRTNGTLWTWGVGSNGRLGDGSTINKSSPVSVAGNFTDWSIISVYGDESAAIRISTL